MSIQSALVSLLRQNATVAKRIRSSTETIDVFKETPHIIFTRIGTDDRELTDDGPTGVVVSRWQLDIFADKSAEASAIADDLRIALDGYTGNVDSTQILLIRFNGERMEAGTKLEGSNNTIARLIVEPIVVYRETVA